MYSIVLSPKARKQLLKLPKDIQKRIISTLERIRVRPEAHLKKLIHDPGWRLRAGDYRIIVDLDQGKLVILVITVGHRKNIYN